MVLLLQLNAELPDRFPGHERRLYVFSCKRKSCRRKEGSIRALRGVRVSPEATAAKEPVSKPTTAPAVPPPTTGLGEALFGVKPGSAAANAAARVNPFASPSSTTTTGATANPFAPKPASTPAAAANLFTQPSATPSPSATEPATTTTTTATTTATLPQTFASVLSLNAEPPLTHGPPPPPEPWPPLSQQPAPYPVRWLADVDYETLDPIKLPAVPQRTTADEMDLDGGSGSGGKEDKEVFESSMDATFQKFADRVGQNPEQCVRYEFGGQPLLYSKTDAVGKLLHHHSGEKVKAGSGIPRCPNCGAGRVFEVQLTPHAIQELEVEEDGLDGMDWGTIIVGVCERDCQERGQKPGETGYVEEWAGVQWEELTVKRQ